MGVVEGNVEGVQGAHGSRGEAVSAHLVAAMGRPIEDLDRCSGPGRPDRGSGAGRSGADHQEVCRLDHGSRLPPSGFGSAPIGRAVRHGARVVQGRHYDSRNDIRSGRPAHSSVLTLMV